MVEKREYHIELNFAINDDKKVEIGFENYNGFSKCIDAENWKKFEKETQKYLKRVRKFFNLNREPTMSGKLELTLDDSKVIDWDEISK